MVLTNECLSSAAFGYSRDCPHNLEQQLSQCSKLHPADDILAFRHMENDLIVAGSRRDIKTSCSCVP